MTTLPGPRPTPSRKLAEGAKRQARRVRPACDHLEARGLLTAIGIGGGGVGVDYTLMGGQWDNSRPISFSIADDGATWDGGTNNVNAQLNGEFGGSGWRNEVATALQTWAASANLDFIPSVDGQYAWNTPGASQGDPRFGDIRVAGYALATNAIAQTYGPPPNGYTAAGDVKLNTSYTFGPTGQWDLETVLIHEVGHSLGLGESPQASAVMYDTYSGVRHDLSGYDVEGIRSIYGPRVADPFQSQGRATSAASALDITGSLNPANVAVINDLSLDSIGDAEYFSVTAPNIQGSTLIVNAVANGHSLMSPKVTVIDAATGATLAADAHPDQYGDTAAVMVPNAQAGHRYLVVVTGATSDVFAVGNYALSVGFMGGTAVGVAAPTPAVPVAAPTPTATNPTPTTAVGGTTSVPTVAPAPGGTAAADPYAANNSFGSAAELGSIAGGSLIRNVKLASAQDVRVFAFEPSRSGLVFVASANAAVVVSDSSGQVVASGRGLVGFAAPVAGARYFVVLMSPDHAPVADASFAVQVVPVAAAPPAVAAIPTTGGIAGSVGHTTATGATTVKIRKRHKHR